MRFFEPYKAWCYCGSCSAPTTTHCYREMSLAEDPISSQRFSCRRSFGRGKLNSGIFGLVVNRINSVLVECLSLSCSLQVHKSETSSIPILPRRRHTSPSPFLSCARRISFLTIIQSTGQMAHLGVSFCLQSWLNRDLPDQIGLFWFIQLILPNP